MRSRNLTLASVATAALALALPGAARMAAAQPVGAVWRSLGDTTLARLVDQALRENLDVRTAEARIRGARAARRAVRADRMPAVTAGAEYTRYRLANTAFPDATGRFPDQGAWDLGVEVGWEVDLFGRIRHNVAARQAYLEAAQQDLRDVQVALIAELARNYFEWRGVQEQHAVALRNAENQRRSLALVRDRLDAGIGSALDTERAQAQLSSTLASVPALEAQIAAAQFRISVLIGQRPTAAPLAPGGGLPAAPAEIALPQRDQLIRRRPDVVAAERRTAAAVANVKASKAAARPRFSLGGTVGLAASGIGSLDERGAPRYAVGPIVSWPVLNRGRVKAAVESSRAEEEETRAQYQLAILRAEEEVEAALVRYRAARARVDQLADAAEASHRAAELARTRFTEGLGDFLQVLDAERTQLAADNLLVAGRIEVTVAYTSLYRALGGDW